MIYTRHFLTTLKKNAEEKWQRHPGIFDRKKMQAASSLYQFDDAVTAPLHGFDDADDYWRRASAKPLLWLPQRLLGFFDQQEVR
jgi:hypothetical protein